MFVLDKWLPLYQAPGGEEGAAPAGGETTPQDTGSESGGEAPFTLTDDINFDEEPWDAEASPAQPQTEATPKEGAPAAPVPGAAQAPQAKPATPAAAVPAATPPAAQATPAPVAPAPQGPSGEVAQPQPATLATMGPAELATELAKSREAVIGHLASTRFQLSKELQDELEVNAIGAIPKVMAAVLYEAQVQMLSNIARFVPNIVGQHIATSQRASEALGDFYKAWPQIDKATHGKEVDEFAQLFRQRDPAMSRADMIRRVGATIVAMHGIQAKPQPNGASPARRGAPPFQPAAAGGRPAQVSQQVVDSFGGLGQEFDSE